MSESTATPETPTQPTPEAQAPGLTIGDLVLSAQVLQRASSAGLFKAEELKTVGDYYERLVKFLESAGAITRTQQTAAQPSQGENK
jgi:hypothetical protein